MNAVVPKTAKGLQSFLGIANWGRDNPADLMTTPPIFPSYISKILTSIIYEPKMNWTDERIATFRRFQELATNSINLHFFVAEEPFCMATDACNKG